MPELANTARPWLYAKLPSLANTWSCLRGQSHWAGMQRSLANLTLSELTRRGIPLPESSCGPPGARWDDSSLRQEMLAALERLRRASVVNEPFAHLRVQPLVSECLYNDLLREIPNKKAYTHQPYPGTSPDYTGIWVNETNLRDFVRREGRSVSIPRDCCMGGGAGVGCPCYHGAMHFHAESSRAGWALPQARVGDNALLSLIHI